LSAKSAFLGLCEGLPNEMPGLRHRYFTQSRDSVWELAGAVDLSAAIGAMDGSQAEPALALRLKRMLGALLTGTNQAQTVSWATKRSRSGSRSTVDGRVCQRTTRNHTQLLLDPNLIVEPRPRSARL